MKSKMKSNIFKASIPALFLFMLSSCGKSDKQVQVSGQEKITGKKSDKTVMINTQESNVKWIGKKVTGKHNGSIKISKGEIYLDGDKISGGNFEIDMNTISIEDLQGEDNMKLLNHLRSDDFFSVEKNPSSKFEITEITTFSNTDKPEFNHTIKGNLTIKGITKSITFPAFVKVESGTVTSKADFDIDRTQWDIRYGSGKFFENLGNKMINDNFNIQFNVNAK